MPENNTGAKASPSFKTNKPIGDATGASREFVQQSATAAKDMYEKTEAAAKETNETLQQTYTAVAKGMAEINVQWIEMCRDNVNSNLDFARDLFGVKSPAEYVQLSTGHVRKQFQTFAEQGQRLTGLAQKVTSDAAQPLTAGAKSVFAKASSSPSN